jgi:selenophosphate synthase
MENDRVATHQEGQIADVVAMGGEGVEGRGVAVACSDFYSFEIGVHFHVHLRALGQSYPEKKDWTRRGMPRTPHSCGLFNCVASF